MPAILGQPPNVEGGNYSEGLSVGVSRALSTQEESGKVSRTMLLQLVIFN